MRLRADSIIPSMKPIATRHFVAKTCAPKTKTRQRVIQPKITVKAIEIALVLRHLLLNFIFDSTPNDDIVNTCPYR